MSSDSRLVGAVPSQSEICCDDDCCNAFLAPWHFLGVVKETRDFAETPPPRSQGNELKYLNSEEEAGKSLGSSGTGQVVMAR